MMKNILVDIPEPCHEDWAAMRPEEKGRFCASCCKTVIDFSLMSDQELLTYLGGASGKVCGRFAADQLRRDLMPAPPRKSRAWVVWNLLLAGLLISSKGRGQGKASRALVGKVAVKKPIVPENMNMQSDTDSFYLPPHITELPPVQVIGYDTGTFQGVGGCVMIISGKTYFGESTESWPQRLISDTLAFLGIGKKDFSLYPNPAPRGTAIKLSINLNKTGRCMVGLYNETGALVQEKSIEASGDEQVELFNIPASLPGGLYFVRLSAPEMKKTYTQKLVVL